MCGALAAVFVPITSPDAMGNVHACYGTKASSKLLRLVQKPTDCKKTETAISWRHTGADVPERV